MEVCTGLGMIGKQRRMRHEYKYITLYKRSSRSHATTPKESILQLSMAPNDPKSFEWKAKPFIFVDDDVTDKPLARLSPGQGFLPLEYLKSIFQCAINFTQCKGTSVLRISMQITMHEGE